jgi:hypothetical protein
MNEPKRDSGGEILLLLVLVALAVLIVSQFLKRSSRSTISDLGLATGRRLDRGQTWPSALVDSEILSTAFS